MNMERLVSSKVMPLQVLMDQLPLVSVNSLNASARLFLSCERMENVGSEVALWKVPARPSAQRGLTYTISLPGIWVQCVVAQVLLFFIEVWSLVSDAPTWNK